MTTFDQMTPKEREALIFGICYSKAELDLYIRAVLGIDLPSETLDQNSNSNALDFVWAVYKCMMTGQGPHRFVVAAARNTAKTLTSAIVRFFGMVHFRRDGVHLAANLDQSQSANKYLNKFFQIPEIAQYVTANNTRLKELSGMPANEYTTRKHNAVLRIAVSTLAGVNSQRGSLNTKDELDLLDREILAESAFIGDPTQDEYSFNPIEIQLSSRKTASGPIQDLIDEAETGKSANLSLHKWSLVDWMKSCPAEIHKPEAGLSTAWINTETLATIWDDRLYQAMTTAERALQKEISVYAGCKTCPAFVVCQARSPQQKDNSKMLRSREFISTVIDTVKIADKIIAQGLNEKPESTAVVFRMFGRAKNFLQPIDMYKFVTGRLYNPLQLPDSELQDIYSSDDQVKRISITPTKKEIFDALVSGGYHINYGVDWGFSPAHATCIVTAYHRRFKKCVVFHVAASQRHSNQQWADYIKENIWSIYPGDLICPDMADPASPSYFKAIPCRDKKPSRIETGVSQLRGLLWSPKEMSTNFAILDDGDMGQNWMLADSMSRWTHRKTAVGFDFDKFEDDDNCDFIDPTRYALDPFVEDVRVGISAAQSRQVKDLAHGAAMGDEESLKILQEKQQVANVFKETLQFEHGVQNPFSVPSGLQQSEPLKPQILQKGHDNLSESKKKKGSIKFSF
jgi:hypothetical protein